MLLGRLVEARPTEDCFLNPIRPTQPAQYIEGAIRIGRRPASTHIRQRGAAPDRRRGVLCRLQDASWGGRGARATGASIPVGHLPIGLWSEAGVAACSEGGSATTRRIGSVLERATRTNRSAWVTFTPVASVDGGALVSAAQLARTSRIGLSKRARQPVLVHPERGRLDTKLGHPPVRQSRADEGWRAIPTRLSRPKLNARVDSHRRSPRRDHRADPLMPAVTFASRPSCASPAAGNGRQRRRSRLVVARFTATGPGSPPARGRPPGRASTPSRSVRLSRPPPRDDRLMSCANPTSAARHLTRADSASPGAPAAARPAAGSCRQASRSRHGLCAERFR